ncbi:MAG TPA: hypothetical protein VGC80_09885 [Acetobacteraceae bacterium]
MPVLPGLLWQPRIADRGANAEEQAGDGIKPWQQRMCRQRHRQRDAYDQRRACQYPAYQRMAEQIDRERDDTRIQQRRQQQPEYHLRIGAQRRQWHGQQGGGETAGEHDRRWW